MTPLWLMGDDLISEEKRALLAEAAALLAHVIERFRGASRAAVPEQTELDLNAPAEEEGPSVEEMMMMDIERRAKRDKKRKRT